MIEKLLLNKRNTVIYKDGEIMPAVFDFNIKVNSQYDGLYEMLQEEPWQIINNAVSYEITIKQYAEGFVSVNNNSSEINFVLPEKTVTFQGCKTVSGETYCDEKGNLVTSQVISCERMC